MVIKLIFLAIAAEAIVYHFLHAAPVQGTREWLMANTPFLYSERQQAHLFQCPICLSFWAGLLMTPFLFLDLLTAFLILGGIVIARLSNFFHVLLSYLQDKQMDLRIKRGK